MPANKNAVIRYWYLDELLADAYHYYSTKDICLKVNNHLEEDGFETVSQRAIEKDIVYLQEAPFSADIERFIYEGKKCVRYKDPMFSIFTKKLSDDEKNLLRETLSTIGQFDGLDNFEWLDKLKTKLGVESGQKIISFSSNPYLKNSDLLGRLFTAISNQQVLELKYHTFDDNTVKSIILHPYLLKQYNNRWFLIGAAYNDGFILNFALDRINSIEPKPILKYKACKKDILERFEDIVGVTLLPRKKVEDILLWVSNDEFNYIDTKPIHASQTVIKGNNDQKLKKKYHIKDGHFIRLNCIVNHELIQTLSVYYEGIVVLKPKSIGDELIKHCKQIINRYSSLRK